MNMDYLDLIQLWTDAADAVLKERKRSLLYKKRLDRLAREEFRYESLVREADTYIKKFESVTIEGEEPTVLWCCLFSEDGYQDARVHLPYYKKMKTIHEQLWHRLVEKGLKRDGYIGPWLQEKVEMLSREIIKTIKSMDIDELRTSIGTFPEDLIAF